MVGGVGHGEREHSLLKFVLKTSALCMTPNVKQKWGVSWAKKPRRAKILREQVIISKPNITKVDNSLMKYAWGLVSLRLLGEVPEPSPVNLT